MTDFVPRKLVNGAILRSCQGGHVAIHMHVENADRTARTITGKTTDDMDVRVDFENALNVAVNGWVQVIGVSKGPNAIQGKEMILFNEDESQQPFDKKATNDVIMFYNNCSGLMNTGKETI